MSKQFLEEQAGRADENSDGSAAPSPVCISLTLAGMAQAAPAFVTLLDASSVAMYFFKTKQVFCFENSSVTFQGWLFLKNGFRQKWSF